MSDSLVKLRLLNSPRWVKQLLAVFNDLALCAVATAVAMDLRHEQFLAWSWAHTWVT